MVGKRQQRRQRKKPVVQAVVASAARSDLKFPGLATLENFYHDQYKRLLLIPFIMLLLALMVLGFNVATTGQLVDTGVSLSGGLTLTVSTNAEPISVEVLTTTLRAQFPDNDLIVREIALFGVQESLSIQVAPKNPSEDLGALEKELVQALTPFIPDIATRYGVEIIGPSLGAAFLQQTVIALLVAFLFMALVVFYYFRTFVPSCAVVLAAFSDIVVTLAVVSLLDMKLSTAGIAAFLMLIGYSVDTDILLSTRVLKRKIGTVYERIRSAVGTGLIMNTTTLVAIVVGLIVTKSEVIAQIMTILLIGLIVDVINTWIQNAGILRWYMETQEGKGK